VSFGASSWPDALALVRRLHPTAEVELLGGVGRPLAADPRPAPVEHNLDARQLALIQRGEMLTLGPVGTAEDSRVFTYMALRACGIHILDLRKGHAQGG
jgi:hypothetical protein